MCGWWKLDPKLNIKNKLLCQWNEIKILIAHDTWQIVYCTFYIQTYKYYSLSVFVTQLSHHNVYHWIGIVCWLKHINDYGADSIAGGGASFSWKFSWLNMLEELRWDLWAKSRESSVSRDIYRNNGWLLMQMTTVSIMNEKICMHTIKFILPKNVNKMEKIIGWY